METTTTPFVAPLGFTCPGGIPVAHTEGAVALDLSAFVPDIVNQIMRAQAAGATSFDELIKSVNSGRYCATPHISIATAEGLAADLLAAAWDAETAGSN